MKGLKLLFFCVLVFYSCDAVDSQESSVTTYQQLLAETSNLFAPGGIFGNGSLQTFVTSNEFQQLTQMFSQSNLLKNAMQFVSNFSTIQQLLQSSNFSQLQNIDLSTLPINMKQVGDIAASFTSLKVSTECITQSVNVIVGLGSGKQWALRMLDASAKIPTDLMNYNLDFYGSFDECVEIQKSNYDIQFQGQYCTAAIYIPGPLTIMQTPPSVQFGLCMPDTCSGDDIKKTLNWLLSMFPSNTTMQFNTVTCQQNDLEFDTKAIVMLVVCGGFILVMITGTLFDAAMIQWPKYQKSKANINSKSTKSKGSNKDSDKRDIEKNHPEISMEEIAVVLDPSITEKQGIDNPLYPTVINGEAKLPENKEEYKTEVQSKDVEVEHRERERYVYKPGFLGKLLLSFSVYTNGKKILNTHQSSGSLTALNGIRFLSMSWVVLGHTLVFGVGNLKNLVTYYPAMIKRVSFQAIANALVSVDSFFTISGLLLTYIVMKEMHRNKGKGKWPRFWFLFYFHRFWRLTPPYMLVLGVYISLGTYFYDGPKWPQGIGIIGDEKLCPESWWLNLLYVNNFFKLDKMCMAWSWYLANDMQFYIISPIMLIPLCFFPVAGVVVTCVVLVGVTITSGVLTKINQWQPTALGGSPSMFNDYYIKPYCRIGPYIVGMITGYILYRTKCKVNINRYLNLLLWVVATVLACLVLYGLYDPMNGNPMNDDVSALYVATHRTVWGACVSWVVFACATGNGGFINTLLSWKAFVPLSRLTYCAYLIHPIIMMLYGQSLRIQQYATDLTITYLFLAHLVLTNLGAFVVSLAFEAPMMGIEKVLLPKK